MCRDECIGKDAAGRFNFEECGGGMFRVQRKEGRFEPVGAKGCVSVLTFVFLSKTQEWEWRRGRGFAVKCQNQCRIA